MSRVTEILYFLLSLGVRLLERLDEKKAEEFRASVLADPAGEWVRLMGGTDRRGSSGSSADNTGSAGH
ncbi:hypothetical protein [Mailhella massiliensis]|uniref:Uncharacterized protein n=1 Tax=Mailhella massiliensis TaxID=1903261 RepID=A0A921DSY5_9BACT|nr:hypothetical protein [Mailhella massiliensis]HJD97502.1 hypothetical protein [Mailhella massiliensis]